MRANSVTVTYPYIKDFSKHQTYGASRGKLDKDKFKKALDKQKEGSQKKLQGFTEIKRKGGLKHTVNKQGHVNFLSGALDGQGEAFKDFKEAGSTYEIPTDFDEDAHKEGYMRTLAEEMSAVADNDVATKEEIAAAVARVQSNLIAGCKTDACKTKVKNGAKAGWTKKDGTAVLNDDYKRSYYYNAVCAEKGAKTQAECTATQVGKLEDDTRIQVTCKWETKPGSTTEGTCVRDRTTEATGPQTCTKVDDPTTDKVECL